MSEHLGVVAATGGSGLILFLHLTGTVDLRTGWKWFIGLFERKPPTVGNNRTGFRLSLNLEFNRETRQDPLPPPNVVTTSPELRLPPLSATVGSNDTIPAIRNASGVTGPTPSQRQGIPIAGGIEGRGHGDGERI